MGAEQGEVTGGEASERETGSLLPLLTSPLTCCPSRHTSLASLVLGLGPPRASQPRFLTCTGSVEPPLAGGYGEPQASAASRLL